jgi:hypothetical protein
MGLMLRLNLFLQTLSQSEAAGVTDELPLGEDLFEESPKPRQDGLSAGCRFEVLTDAVEGLLNFGVEALAEGDWIGREK